MNIRAKVKCQKVDKPEGLPYEGLQFQAVYDDGSEKTSRLQKRRPT